MSRVRIKEWFAMSPGGRTSWAFFGGVATIVVGMLGLAALQYFMPASTHFTGPMNPEGARETAQWLLGKAPVAVGLGTYVWTFRVLVVAVWAGYAAVIFSALRAKRLPTRGVLVIAGALAVALAVLFPPSLSHDLYAYLAYGRMEVLRGWNPYVHTLREFALLGDAAAAHYPQGAASVYGPVWTLLSTGLVAALSAIPTAAQLVAFKLVEALALIGAGLSARAIARVWDPDHADVAFVAVMLNPMLLLEGPSNGHNDVLMVALLLAGIALVLRSSWAGWPVIGLSVGIKFVTIAIVPWLVFQQVRSLPMRRAIVRGAAAVALVLAPVALLFIPYVTGSALEGFNAVWSAKAAGNAGAGLGLIAVVAVYALVSLWVLLGREDRVAPAWTLWSISAALLLLPIILPWYMAWPTLVTLTRWDRRQRVLTAICVLLTFALSLRYSLLRGM